MKKKRINYFKYFSLFFAMIVLILVVGCSGPTPTTPIVNSFSAFPSTITVGESSTLSWSVTDATTVTINQSIGSVALISTTTVSPATTTTYTLTATNTAGSVTATAQIVVTTALPVEHTVTLKPIVDESGYVRDTGQVTPKYMYVGDDTNNISLQAFMSFDISGIPAGAIISSVVVDFSDHASIYGDPFSSLGCLRAYPHDYGTLDGGDYFTGNPLGAVIRYCSASEIVAGSDPEVATALQAKVGSSRFQMRLQFRDSETDNDSNNDMVRWTSAHLPELVVTYSTP